MPAGRAGCVSQVTRVVVVSQFLLPETKAGDPTSGPGISPQLYMVPLSRMTEVWYPPADTATAVRPVPRSIAVDEGALVCALIPPSPNIP